MTVELAVIYGEVVGIAVVRVIVYVPDDAETVAIESPRLLVTMEPFADT